MKAITEVAAVTFNGGGVIIVMDAATGSTRIGEVRGETRSRYREVRPQRAFRVEAYFVSGWTGGIWENPRAIKVKKKRGREPIVHQEEYWR